MEDNIESWSTAGAELVPNVGKTFLRPHPPHHNQKSKVFININMSIILRFFFWVQRIAASLFKVSRYVKQQEESPSQLHTENWRVLTKTKDPQDCVLNIGHYKRNKDLSEYVNANFLLSLNKWWSWNSTVTLTMIIESYELYELWTLTF